MKVMPFRLCLKNLLLLNQVTFVLQGGPTIKIYLGINTGRLAKFLPTTK
jgi:hypothetical protein